MTNVPGLVLEVRGPPGPIASVRPGVSKGPGLAAFLKAGWGYPKGPGAKSSVRARPVSLSEDP